MNSSKVNAVVVNLLEQYLSSGAWAEARQLARDDDRFSKCCREDGSEILNLLMQYLDDTNYEARIELYNTAEFLLKTTAELGNPQDMAMEFLDLLDRVESDNVLVSLMKGLKEVLLRQPEKKALTLEMCLESLLRYLRRIPGPDRLETTFEAEKVAFLESDSQIARILNLHLILLLFLEPIVDMVVREMPQDWTQRTLENTRHNVLVHFLLNVLSTDLNRIYIPYEDDKNTNTYIRQCRESVTRMLTELLGCDPFALLPFIERRIRYPIEVSDSTMGIKQMNVFILPDKTSITAYGHYFHTLLIHGLVPGHTPKIYTRGFVFLRFVYLVTEMLKSEDQNLQMKGVELGHTVLQLVQRPGEPWSKDLLELSIFENFFERIIHLMTFSENELIRKHSVKYAELMILAFDDRGRIIILENLFREFDQNHGLCGYLPILYKNMVVDALNTCQESGKLPPEYSGAVFQKMLLEKICRLPDAEKTNILDHSNQILAALNLIRFIALRDLDNRTSFWDVKQQLVTQFLEVLRLAIDLSRAHYLQHKKSIEEGTDVTAESDMSLTMFGKEMPELSRDQKLTAMTSCLNNFDLMESLLARANECIHSGEEARKKHRQ